MSTTKTFIFCSSKPKVKALEGICSIELDQDGKFTIAEAVYTSGLIEAPYLCSGLGSCGLCAVKFIDNSLAPSPTLKDTKVLGSDKVLLGWRLGCQHKASVGMTFQIEVSSSYLQSKHFENISIDSTEQFLAIDYGTTSVHFQIGTKDTSVIASGSFKNPQSGVGSDIISRISFASKDEGLKLLSDLSQQSVRNILSDYSNLNPSSIFLAANSAITCMFLGKSCASLGFYPYHLAYGGGQWEHVSNLPPIYVAPLISAFVGGDISAGYISILENSPSYPFLFIDLGTNAEFILAFSPDKIVAGSVPLGPALEGIGLSYGVAANKNAITDFLATPKGFVPINKIEQTSKYSGITGTGYLSLLSNLLTRSILKKDGLWDAKALERLNLLSPNTEKAPNSLYVCESFFLHPKDIETILQVKAAFNLGLSLLLHHSGINLYEIKDIYLSGAFGNHVSLSALETVGFIPPGSSRKVSTLGNSSLNGAVCLAKNLSLRDAALTLNKTVETIPFATDPLFSSNFPAAMQFGWVPLHL